MYIMYEMHEKYFQEAYRDRLFYMYTIILGYKKNFYNNYTIISFSILHRLHCSINTFCISDIL